MKGDTYPEEGIVLLASQLVGRPVKWISARSDALILDNAGADRRRRDGSGLRGVHSGGACKSAAQSWRLHGGRCFGASGVFFKANPQNVYRRF